MNKVARGLCGLGLTAIVFASAQTQADTIVQVLDDRHDVNQGLLGNVNGADTFIFSGDLNNYGNSGLFLYEQRVHSSGIVYGRSMIKFPLPTLPAGATLNSATLSLKLSANTAGATADVSLNRMLVDWEEMEATWAQRKTGTNWSTPGMAAGTDYESSAQDTLTVIPLEPLPTPQPFYDFNITSAVMAWYDGTPNYGVAILSESPTPNNSVLTFYNTESFQTFDLDTEPVLTIDYTIGGLVGDLNGDGFVGLADLDIVLGNWNANVTPGDLLAGDPTGDGFVGLGDLDIVLGNWNAGTPPASVVPEPATLGLLGLGLAAIARRRR